VIARQVLALDLLLEPVGVAVRLALDAHQRLALGLGFKRTHSATRR
jgi:hypothetical protein